MITKIWKSGNSMVVTLPRKEMEYAVMMRGTKVKVECSAVGEIRIRKVEWAKDGGVTAKGGEWDEE